MNTAGLAHLCHHSVHWEWCYDFKERAEYIRSSKAISEVEERLKWFQIVPQERLPVSLQEAGEAYGEAEATYNKVEDAYDKAWEAYDEAWVAYRKAWVAKDEAGDAYKRALEAAAPELAILHAELFAGCPWDAEQGTMFPK